MSLSHLLNILISLVLLLFVLATAAGAGFRILLKRWIDIKEKTMLPLFILPFGLGLIAYGVVLIGLLSLLRPIVLIITLVLLTFFLRAEIYIVFVSLIGWFKAKMMSYNRRSLTFWLVILCFGFLFGFTLIQTLTPPWDYDGLMYHLQLPKQYLSMHSIHPIQNNWLTYYPSLVEMLYTLGLAFNVDVFARLINLVYGVWLAFVTYYLCKRFDEPRTGQLAAMLLVTIPIYSIWASLSYIDLAWALYEFVGLIALLEWWECREQKWLAWSGLMVGFAVGSKYMGIFAALIILFMAAWKMHSQPRVEIRRNIFIYLGMVILGSFPWYFKNLIWTGNPFFPMIYRPAGEIGE